jgi:hypothetical protein
MNVCKGGNVEIFKCFRKQIYSLKKALFLRKIYFMDVAIFECHKDNNKIAITPDVTGGNLPAKFCKWVLVKHLEFNEQSPELYEIPATDILAEIDKTGYCAIVLKLTIRSTGFQID